MFFVKEIRAVTPISYGPSGWVAPTQDEVTQLGVLDTQTRPGKELELRLGAQHLPEEIILRTRIQSVPLENRATTFALYVEDKAFPLVPFYGAQLLEQTQRGHLTLSQNQSVALIFTGHGYARCKGTDVALPQARVTLSQGSCLLRKNFLLQRRPHLVQRHKRLEDGQWLITPAYGGGPQISCVPLMAYGGYVRAGAPLEKISQVFGGLERAGSGKGYKLILRTQRELEESHIGPPHGGSVQSLTYVYIDSFEPGDLLSLAGMIEMGQARLSLTLPGQDQEEATLYRSWRYVQQDPATGCVDLYFKQTQ